MYLLAKFRLCILKLFEVTALQSSNKWKIDLYSRYKENILQTLTKMGVTYEWSSAANRYWKTGYAPVIVDLSRLMYSKSFNRYLFTKYACAYTNFHFNN